MVRTDVLRRIVHEDILCFNRRVATGTEYVESLRACRLVVNNYGRWIDV